MLVVGLDFFRSWLGCSITRLVVGIFLMSLGPLAMFVAMPWKFFVVLGSSVPVVVRMSFLTRSLPAVGTFRFSALTGLKAFLLLGT